MTNDGNVNFSRGPIFSSDQRSLPSEFIFRFSFFSLLSTCLFDASNFLILNTQPNTIWCKKTSFFIQNVNFECVNRNCCCLNENNWKFSRDANIITSSMSTRENGKVLLRNWMVLSEKGEVYSKNGQVSILNDSKPLYNFRLIEFSRIRGFCPSAYFVKFCWNAAIPKRINQTIKQLRIYPETQSTPIHNDKMFICIPFGNIMYA